MKRPISDDGYCWHVFYVGALICFLATQEIKLYLVFLNKILKDEEWKHWSAIKRPNITSWSPLSVLIWISKSYHVTNPGATPFKKIQNIFFEISWRSSIKISRAIKIWRGKNRNNCAKFSRNFFACAKFNVGAKCKNLSTPHYKNVFRKLVVILKGTSCCLWTLWSAICREWWWKLCWRRICAMEQRSEDQIQARQPPADTETGLNSGVEERFSWKKGTY